MYTCIICDIYKLINNTYMRKGFKENGTAKSVRKPDLFKANTYVSHIFFFFYITITGFSHNSKYSTVYTYICVILTPVCAINYYLPAAKIKI